MGLADLVGFADIAVAGIPIIMNAAANEVIADGFDMLSLPWKRWYATLSVLVSSTYRLILSM
jgi:hypothetical protein